MTTQDSKRNLAPERLRAGLVWLAVWLLASSCQDNADEGLSLVYSCLTYKESCLDGPCPPPEPIDACDFAWMSDSIALVQVTSREFHDAEECIPPFENLLVRQRVQLVELLHGQRLAPEFDVYTVGVPSRMSWYGPDDTVLVGLIQHEGYYHPLAALGVHVGELSDSRDECGDLTNEPVDLPTDTGPLRRALTDAVERYDAVCMTGVGRTDGRSGVLERVYESSDSCQ